jgi:hypothetical protein
LAGSDTSIKVEERTPMSDRHPLVKVLKTRAESPMYKVLFRQATSYGSSAKLLSELVLVSNNPDFVAPVLMCKVFAVELLLKFFLVVDYRKIYSRKDLETHHISFRGPFEHEYEALFDRIPRKHRTAIIKAFSKIVAKATSEKEFCVILSAFEDGFIKWRYIHEEEHQKFLGMRLLGQIGDALWSYANLQVLRN